MAFVSFKKLLMQYWFGIEPREVCSLLVVFISIFTGPLYLVSGSILASWIWITFFILSFPLLFFIAKSLVFYNYGTDDNTRNIHSAYFSSSVPFRAHLVFAMRSLLTYHIRYEYRLGQVSFYLELMRSFINLIGSDIFGHELRPTSNDWQVLYDSLEICARESYKESVRQNPDRANYANLYGPPQKIEHPQFRTMLELPYNIKTAWTDLLLQIARADRPKITEECFVYAKMMEIHYYKMQKFHWIAQHWIRECGIIGWENNLLDAMLVFYDMIHFSCYRGPIFASYRDHHIRCCKTDREYNSMLVDF